MLVLSAASPNRAKMPATPQRNRQNQRILPNKTRCDKNAGGARGLLAAADVFNGTS